MSKSQEPTKRAKWTESDIEYVVNAFNALQKEGHTRKDPICTEIARKTTLSTSKIPSRSFEQVRRKIEDLIKNQDSRIDEVRKWVTERGGVRAEKSFVEIPMPESQRTLKAAITYGTNSTNKNNSNSTGRLKLGRVLQFGDSSEEESNSRRKISLDGSDDHDGLEKPKKRLSLTSEENSRKPVLIASPRKQASLEHDEQEDPLPSLSGILNFSSFQSPVDSTWWSYISVMPGTFSAQFVLFPGLRPQILDAEDESRFRLLITIAPPSAEQLERFPPKFVQGIRCPTNSWLLEAEREMELEAFPPNGDVSYKFRVHPIRPGPEQPAHHIVIEWYKESKLMDGKPKLF